MQYRPDTVAIAFEGSRRVAFGSLAEVALGVREIMDRQERTGAARSILVLDALTSTAIDLDLRGSPRELVERYRAGEGSGREDSKSGHAAEAAVDKASRGPGRPRLGVVAREVTLLPRHWDWLATQPGGASNALRKLVEQARSVSVDRDRAREASEATYKFMMHLAGNEAGFEEATRALFAGERERFQNRIAMWPEDVREHAARLAESAFPASNQSG